MSVNMADMLIDIQFNTCALFEASLSSGMCAMWTQHPPFTNIYCVMVPKVRLSKGAARFIILFHRIKIIATLTKF